MDGNIALALARKYTNDTSNALGAVKGAPCTIKNVESTDAGKKIIFEWTGNDGAKQTTELELFNGEKGEPGKTISVMVNDKKYEPVDGVITLPDYPTGSDGGTQTFKYSDKKPAMNATNGEIVFNSSPEPNGFVGWVYTPSGWLGFGQIEGASSQAVPNAFILNDGTEFLVRNENGSGIPFLYHI